MLGNGQQKRVVAASHPAVRPRLSSLLRVVLNHRPPLDPDKAYLDRGSNYAKAIAAAAAEGDDGDLVTGMAGLSAGTTSAEQEVPPWDVLLKASTRGGRMGGFLTGEVKDAFHRLVRMAGQLAGEEGAMEAASGLLFEVAASHDAVDRRGEFENLLQRPVKESTWLQAVSWAEVLAKWYREEGPGSSFSSSGRLPKRKRGGEIWGSSVRFQEGFANIPELRKVMEEEEDEEERREQACYALPSFSFKSDRSERIDGPALLARCELHVAIVGGVGLGPLDLGKGILEILERSTDEVELQTRLFDLLGAEGFDLIGWILEHMPVLRMIKHRDLKQRGGAYEGGMGGPSAGLSAALVSRPARPVTVGPSVTIMTEEEKRLEKERRKDDRRARKQQQQQQQQRRGGDATVSGERGEFAAETGGLYSAPLEFDALDSIDWVGILGFDPRSLAEDGKMEKRELLPEGSRQFWGNKGKGLPPGAVKTFKPGFEQVYIPAPVRAAPVGRCPLVEVAGALETWSQPAFKGIKMLNRIQSEVFEAAYHSQENLLICAPTGAGKTNIAMLALLALVREHVKEGRVQKGPSLKAIYIAPMKALAQEVVSKFSERLKALGLVVRELTGDMQLTKKEIEESQLIVTTPEKWDVVTRKGGEGSLAAVVGLVIIDEVHLLADERGAVIESIVARSQRLVETSQRSMRLVGLSATLPNYKDVALFLRASPKRGLFHFGPEYRPVPLEMTFIGVTEKQKMRQLNLMNDIAYARALDAVRQGHQVMIFVHSRKDTTRTAQAIKNKAAKMNTLSEFSCMQTKVFAAYASQVSKSRNADLREHFDSGLGIHHAGMLRPDRSLTERMFEDGALKVLVCTATLAWGINLPAHTVLIKGTEVYNPDKGGFADLSMLDVMQIFGRAGRPQYDTSGEAVMITTHQALPRYLALLTDQMPIESSFIKQLPDHLNAEVVSGTVTNVREGAAWLAYTYLYIRMLKNPMAYGVTYEEAAQDPMLDAKRLELITNAARVLDQNRMVRFDPRSGNLAVTDMGRTASHYYIMHESVEQFNGLLSEILTEAQALHVLCAAKEFDEVKVRPEELDEVDQLRVGCCPLEVGAAVEESAGKANVLLQAYVSRARVSGFTVISDTNYVAQNAGRVGRALFEVCLRKGWCSVAAIFLRICKALDRRMWWYECPLRQFDTLSWDVVRKLEEKHASIPQLLDMTASEIGQLVQHMRSGKIVLDLARKLPYLEMSASVQPITRGILRMTVKIQASFDWSDRWHGTVEPWWIWVEDAENERVYHSEPWLLHKRQRNEVHVVAFTIPIFEPLPPQYTVRAVSDRWVGAESSVTVSFRHLILPDRHPPHTDLLDLAPLPKRVLQHEEFESLYCFSHFNPIQTQAFHVLYHTDANVLVGAPTGSGKTLLAELAVLRLINQTAQATANARAKTVYIAPLKALARERLQEWRKKLGETLGLVVLELSGDVTPDVAALKRADIIVATPEKWDGITRSWKKRDYVGDVRLLIMDEIHLLGEDRGPVLEVIVSRMRYIAAQKRRPVRMLGLSTALANPRDLADWLGVGPEGLFNFRPSVRPIPMDVHVAGFPGRHYCPRMATMNKPTYQAVMEHSPRKPALIFVSSRRQTRLTALELISLCAQGEDPKCFLHMPEDEVADMALTCRDAALRHTLVFGVGIHHAGLDDHDRVTVEMLFVTGKIQVLVCTSTLAWGVNFPAHLVVIKGTEYFDGKTGRYVDFPVTDVLQMMGRAGRPQFDTHGVACILVHEPKKNFIKKFLYEPFPVESSLKGVLHNHLSAEIAGGAILSKEMAMEYLTWTFFFRRLVMNPTYYHLEDTAPEAVQRYLLELVDGTLQELAEAGCVELDEDNFGVKSTVLGQVASYYYLDYRSVGRFREVLADAAFEGGREGAPVEAKANAIVPALATLLAEAQEYEELPVRHNEDLLNAGLAEEVGWSVRGWDMGSSHTKAYLLLQAHFQQLALPIADYVNDTKSVLDQAPRILNAMVDISADLGLLPAALGTMRLAQMMVQALGEDDSPLLQLPSLRNVIGEGVKVGEREGKRRTGEELRGWVMADEKRLRQLLVEKGISGVEAGRVAEDLRRLGVVTVKKVRILEPVDGLDGKGGDGGGGSEATRPVLMGSGGRSEVVVDQDYILEVTLTCRPGRGGGPPMTRSRFNKHQAKQGGGGWWLALGEAEEELLALKRFTVGQRGGDMKIVLTFPAPVAAGLATLQLHLKPDNFLGLDQRVEVKVEAVGGKEEENFIRTCTEIR
ncbi:hypothetical protein VYU27_004769 [Nannochloropsis oceanica]